MAIPELQVIRDAVYTHGQNTAGMSCEASACAQGFLTDLDCCKVGHPVVEAALQNFRTNWTEPANAFPAAVECCGNNTSGSAVDVDNGDTEACHAQEPAVQSIADSTGNGETANSGQAGYDTRYVGVATPVRRPQYIGMATPVERTELGIELAREI